MSASLIESIGTKSPGRSFARRSEKSNTARTRVHIPPAIWIAMALAFAWGSLTINSLLTPGSLVVLPLLAFLLWRPGEPPVLVFACVMQWLQAAALIFYANYYNISLLAAFGGPQLELATWLSLGGVIALAIGMRAALFRVKQNQGRKIAAEARRMVIETVFAVYILCFVMSLASDILAPKLGGAKQLILSITAIKWVLVYILGCVAFEQRRYGLLVLCIALEFSFGLLGFFAGFKNVFFVLAVVVFTSVRAFEARRLVVTGAICLILVITGSAWSAVKGEYREFLNLGFVTQEVLVPVSERISKLGTLLADFDWEQMTQGFETLVLRTGYVEFFARTIANVPEKIPYENGALWGGAIKHVLTPRILFPNKPALDDSERTCLYTGIDVAGADEGTSIGIGYFGESYIDFGPVFMFGPILLLGVFYGLIYRCFIVRAQHKLLGSGIAASILIFGAYNIETSNVKVIGGNLTVLIGMVILYKLFGNALVQVLEGSRPFAPRKNSKAIIPLPSVPR